jgi:branched-chain amino acid transport system ATP-binding protein
VKVAFGGLLALNDAHVDVVEGRITGLIGPNGAGKTTLFNVITGLQPPTAGTVHFANANITRLGVHKRARLGISRTFQKLEAFNTLSARENVLVAAEQKFSPREAATITDEIVERIGLIEVADITVGTLPTGTARLVELARAMACKPRALLLDEASSGLTEDETEVVGSLLKRLVVEDNLGILLVEHDMSFVMDVCDWIHVLDFGEVIAVGEPDEIQQDPRVRTAYLGAEAMVDTP